jgi:hypothetical protein
MVPPPAGWPTSPTKPLGQQGPQKWPPVEDNCHPKICLLMDPYLSKYNNYIDLSAILTALGKWVLDLPSLPQYCAPTEIPLICWNNVLGCCFRGRQCKFLKGHLCKGNVTDNIAESVTDCIGKGVLYYTDLPQAGTSPGK